MLKKIWFVIKSVLEPVAKLISAIINFVFLFIVYFTAIGFVSILMKLFGKHFLEIKKIHKNSNWHEHKVTKQSLEQYYRTF